MKTEIEKEIEKVNQLDSCPFTISGQKGRAICFNNHMITIVAGPIIANYHEPIAVEVGIISTLVNRLTIEPKDYSSCSMWFDVDTEQQAMALESFILNFNENHTPDPGGEESEEIILQ